MNIIKIKLSMRQSNMGTNVPLVLFWISSGQKREKKCPKEFQKHRSLTYLNKQKITYMTNENLPFPTMISTDRALS